MNHTYTHKEQFINTLDGTHTSGTQQENMTTNPRYNSSQENRRVNNRQKDSVNSVPLYGNFEEPSQESNMHTRTRCGRII